MEISYWQSRWKKDHTGWHMDTVYPNLPDYWPKLNLNRKAAVLVPLCGKSLDMLWLNEQGHRVIGVDVSKKAAQSFFEDNALSYETDSKASFTIYKSGGLEIWVGDLFKLKPHFLPGIAAIYDKAALIALPEEKREPYAGQIWNLCNKDTQILINTFEYKQEEMSGPPFAVHFEEVKQLYGEHFSIELLHEESIFENLPRFQQRGLSSHLIEKVYHLHPAG